MDMGDSTGSMTQDAGMSMDAMGPTDDVMPMGND